MEGFTKREEFYLDYASHPIFLGKKGCMSVIYTVLDCRIERAVDKDEIVIKYLVKEKE